MKPNRYPGTCHACGAFVKRGEGVLECVGRAARFVVWCRACFDASDHSSYEDRECGDRAYEDACARAVDY